MRKTTRIIWRLRLALGRIAPGLVQRYDKRYWERYWSKSDRKAKWMNRAVPQEVESSIESGWLPASGAVLDIGCGEGAAAAWFAEKGYTAVGCDISSAAVRRAAETHQSPNLRFAVLDAAGGTLESSEKFDIFLDRGCLHVIHPSLAPAYARNLAAMSNPGARLLIIMKAFRDGSGGSTEEEQRERTEWIRTVMAPHFTLERVERTFMDPFGGTRPDKAMGGLVFYMTRTPGPN